MCHSKRQVFRNLATTNNLIMMHQSQRVLDYNGEYADFELLLAPTYDFVMRLLHVMAVIEVISPTSLRKTMKGWFSDMYDLYKND